MTMINQITLLINIKTESAIESAELNRIMKSEERASSRMVGGKVVF